MADSTFMVALIIIVVLGIGGIVAYDYISDNKGSATKSEDKPSIDNNRTLANPNKCTPPFVASDIKEINLKLDRIIQKYKLIEEEIEKLKDKKVGVAKETTTGIPVSPEGKEASADMSILKEAIREYFEEEAKKRTERMEREREEYISELKKYEERYGKYGANVMSMARYYDLTEDQKDEYYLVYKGYMDGRTELMNQFQNHS